VKEGSGFGCSPFFMGLELNSFVVGAPGGDAFLDLLGGQAFRDGLFGEGGEFGVGGEAEADQLACGELVNDGTVTSHQKVEKAEAAFEANDAVLHFEGIDA
jgi:hypothetical protein